MGEEGCRSGVPRMFRAAGAFRATRPRRLFQGQDAWRDHKYVNVNENMKIQHMMPGFINAAGIFLVYIILDGTMGMFRNMNKQAHKAAQAQLELKKLKREHGLH